MLPEFLTAIRSALTSEVFEEGNDIISRWDANFRRQIQILYDFFLLIGELAAEREAEQKKLAAANSRAAEAVRCQASAEEEVVRLRELLQEKEAEVAELRKAGNDADDSYLRLQRRTACVADLEAKVADLEAKVAGLTSQTQELQTTMAQLKKGEGIDWSMAINCTPVRDCLYSMAVTAVREAVQERDPLLNLIDFLDSGAPKVGPEGGCCGRG